MKLFIVIAGLVQFLFGYREAGGFVCQNGGSGEEAMF